MRGPMRHTTEEAWLAGAKVDGRGGLGAGYREPVRVGYRMIQVARIRITDTGRRRSKSDERL